MIIMRLLKLLYYRLLWLTISACFKPVWQMNCWKWNRWLWRSLTRREIPITTTALMFMRQPCWRHAENRWEGWSTFPTFHILFLVGIAALRGTLWRKLWTEKRSREPGKESRQHEITTFTGWSHTSVCKGPFFAPKTEYWFPYENFPFPFTYSLFHRTYPPERLTLVPSAGLCTTVVWGSCRI